MMEIALAVDQAGEVQVEALEAVVSAEEEQREATKQFYPYGCVGKPRG